MHKSCSLITRVPRLIINLHIMIMIMIIGNYDEKKGEIMRRGV